MRFNEILHYHGIFLYYVCHFIDFLYLDPVWVGAATVSILEFNSNIKKKKIR